MMKHKRFALFGNIFQAKKSSSIHSLLEALSQRGAEVFVDRPFYDYLVDELGIQMEPAGLIDGNDFEADVVVSLGGDGTFLEAAGRVRDKGIPILGVNMGRLGFLADVPAEEVECAVEDIYNNQCTIEQHSLLEVEMLGAEAEVYPYALNEVAVLKRDNSSMISIDVDINQQRLTTYQADGLIINTPTGSTGYALSVGGPMVMAQCGVFGLTAVAPHMLNMRPIILPDSVEVHLSVRSRNHQFLVAIDGHSQACDEKVELILRRAPYDIHVLKRAGSSQFSTLRSKLMWGADYRNPEL